MKRIDFKSKKTRRFLYVFLLTSLMYMCWIGFNRVYQYLIPYQWLEVLLTLATLPFLLWQTIRFDNWIRKRFL